MAPTLLKGRKFCSHVPSQFPVCEYRKRGPRLRKRERLGPSVSHKSSGFTAWTDHCYRPELLPRRPYEPSKRNISWLIPGLPIVAVAAATGNSDNLQSSSTISTPLDRQERRTEMLHQNRDSDTFSFPQEGRPTQRTNSPRDLFTSPRGV